MDKKIALVQIVGHNTNNKGDITNFYQVTLIKSASEPIIYRYADFRDILTKQMKPMLEQQGYEVREVLIIDTEIKGETKKLFDTEIIKEVVYLNKNIESNIYPRF